jgi:hypothetical protein
MGKRAYLERAGTQAVRKAGANLLSKGGSHSIMSFFSIGSILSAGSILSIGSVGSILSIGSSGSILSIGSAGSILGLGSAGYSPFREREEDEDS